MFRVTQMMQELITPSRVPLRKPKGPVVIWNLIRRCNLTCKHCYSISADKNFPGELSLEQIDTVMDDLKAFHVPVLILSGGEPLLHPHIYTIAKRAKAMGFYVGLSTNGTLITQANINAIAEIGFNYVGISIDGLETTHDKFRRQTGAFAASMQAIALCQQHGIKVGLRFTLTQDNAKEFPAILQLMQCYNIDKFYLSHLNYSGRGNRNRQDDANYQMTRQSLDLLFHTCWQQLQTNQPKEYVTGNNDADGVYFYHWVSQHYPDKADHIKQRLQQWGGNSSGVNIANIDNLGEVHPDTFWWDYPLGNVKQRPFSKIWQDHSDPLMAGLKQSPRPLQGRCHACQYQAICGGNTRVRAYQLTNNAWAEDPGCYLTDNEIGVSYAQTRLKVTPYSKQQKKTEKTQHA